MPIVCCSVSMFFFLLGLKSQKGKGGGRIEQQCDVYFVKLLFSNASPYAQMTFPRNVFAAPPSFSAASADNEQGKLEGAQIFDPLFLLMLPNMSSSAHICSSRILHLSLWFISCVDVLLAVLALSLNSLLTASILITRPLPVSIQRSLSVISISYAFLAAILLAKKTFWLFSALSAGSPCVPFVSSVGCKLQEFPVLAVYLHSLASPLVFSVQMYTKGLNNPANCNVRKRLYSPMHYESVYNVLAFLPPPPRRRSSIDTHPQFPTFLLRWLCSSHHLALVVLCLALAFLFTVFDHEPLRRRVLVNVPSFIAVPRCSLPLAVRQKEFLFALLTLILCSQLVQSLLWQSLSVSVHQQHKLGQQSRDTFVQRSSALLLYLALSFRDLFLVEAFLWSLSAFLTGSALLQQFVLLNPCGKCTRLLVELTFTTLPLIAALSHPILSVLIVAPISYSAQQLCPLLKKALPEQELSTPPLPRPVPTVRILVTEH